MPILNTPHYNIVQGAIQHTLKEFLAKNSYSRIAVIVDNNTKKHCFPLIKDILPANTLIIEIEAGEINKTLDTCQQIWQQMITAQLNRNALVINLGGGVIGDMGGFCAATFKRGIRFVQVPTTVLSQVDASVGGKLGIDFQCVKNSIGLFSNPEQVFLDTAFFKTLPEREIKSGFAEIIKHALIADIDEWEDLQDTRTINANIIFRSVEVKRDIVVEDPFEKGIRKALNFGHTIGHAIESIFLEKEHHLLHGEAIAIGMICEAYLSHKTLGLSKAKLDNIRDFILDFYGKIELNPAEFPSMLALMKNDKKNRGNEINFSLLPDIGAVKVNQTAKEQLIIESLNYYTHSVFIKNSL